jgi:hypothetical protein
LKERIIALSEVNYAGLTALTGVAPRGRWRALAHASANPEHRNLQVKAELERHLYYIEHHFAEKEKPTSTSTAERTQEEQRKIGPGLSTEL